MAASKIGRKISLLFLLVTSLLLSLSCKPAGHHPAHGKPAMHVGLPRVSPAYVQWLTQQSMLGEAEKLISEVSGTTRVWQNSGSEERFAFLLKTAPNWLDVNPHLDKGLQPAFTTLANPVLLAELVKQGFQGIFLAPSGETADIWAKIPSRESDGEDLTAFTFCREAGDDKAFSQFLKATSQAGLEIGGNLPAAATGLGPDFMLQARGLRSYEGLYAAVEIPHEFWSLLPDAKDEWQVKKLSLESHQKLAEAGLLPRHLHKDRALWADPAAWAATGVVQGLDGSQRRWVYACVGTSRPVLFWQDPSGHAKRLFSAAAIRHTGFQQHALAGLPLKALMGLDALGPQAQTEDLSEDLEPGLSALGELSQAVHRYGGWSLFPESLPPQAIPLVLQKVDFVRDSITPLAVCYALLTEDTGPLNEMLSTSFRLRIPHARLAHGLNAWKAEDLRLFRQLPQGQKLSDTFSKLSARSDAKLFTTRPMAWPSRAANAEEDAKRTLLELAVPLGMPGLFFLNPSELRTIQSSLSDGKTPFSNLLQARRSLGLAQASLMPSPKAPHGCLLLKNQLPDGGFWITAVNFAKKAHELTVPLSKDVNELFVYDLSTQSLASEVTKRNASIILTIAPRQAKHLYVGKKRSF
ncbi:MAG: hypothetical protein K6G15_09975 [Desulfovibrio sp.]|nr:hypothetical protein [Desulfovibrio sp.]